MTLTNYWWLLIWIFIGGVLALFIPKQQELVNGRKVEKTETVTLRNDIVIALPGTE